MRGWRTSPNISGTDGPITYTYDARHRLTEVCYQASPCTGGSDPFIRWTYDPVSNRLVVLVVDGVARRRFVARGSCGGKMSPMPKAKSGATPPKPPFDWETRRQS